MARASWQALHGTRFVPYPRRGLRDAPSANAGRRSRVRRRAAEMPGAKQQARRLTGLQGASLRAS
jgi:hypothetical protein